jgi:peroxiredoxin
LHSAKERIDGAGFQVILVGLEGPEHAEKFRKEFAPSLPVICDPEKQLYRAYGLGRTTVSGIASPGILLRGLRTMAQGHTPGIPGGDVFQMPGVFMIDREGNIRYSYYSKDVSDHPSIEELLALKSLLDGNE